MKLLFADGGRKTILHDALSKLVGAKCSTKTSITTPFHEITLNIIIVVAHFAVFCCGCMQEMIPMLHIERLLANNEQFCYFVN